VGCFVGLITCLDRIYAAIEIPRWQLFLSIGSFYVVWAVTNQSLGMRIYTAAAPLHVYMLFCVQCLSGFFMDPQLLILSAAQIPILFPRRAGLIVLGTVIVLLSAFGVFFYLAGGFEVSEELKHLPPMLGSLFTIMQIAIWTLFAFSAGYLIVQLELQRRQILWTNGELLGTQQLLADSSRFSERLRISRELHDVVGHHLVSLSLNLEVAERKANDEAVPALERCRLVARLLLAEIREVVSTMREEKEIALEHALRLLVDSIPHLKVELMLKLPANLSPQHAHVLFRACEEALTNINKHSSAKEVSIAIEAHAERLNLVIQDDGRGAEKLEAGNGLRGMQERFREVYGDLEWATAPGRGVTLSAWLPLLRGVR
jgi:signal transduction histidine kinase